MTQHLKMAAALLVAALSTACAYNISPYGVSAENVEAMRTKLGSGNRQLAVDGFSATEPGRKSITCRAAGSVTAPDGKTFEAYVQEALVTELKLAGIYKEGAGSRLTANLTKVDFNSNIGAGKWYIDAMVSVNGDSFKVSSETPFDASFVADKACQETAQTFPIAVQNFIKTIISHPKFISLATK